MNSWGTPGIDGSLGVCAYCGENFLKEIVFGEGVPGQCLYKSSYPKCRFE